MIDVSLIAMLILRTLLIQKMMLMLMLLLRRTCLSLLSDWLIADCDANFENVADANSENEPVLILILLRPTCLSHLSDWLRVM